VLRACKEEIEPYGPLIVGVDPARKGADSTAIAWRRGHCIVKTERRHRLDTMELRAGLLRLSVRTSRLRSIILDRPPGGRFSSDGGHGELCRKPRFDAPLSDLFP
jgi:hypothetical protein